MLTTDEVSFSVARVSNIQPNLNYLCPHHSKFRLLCTSAVALKKKNFMCVQGDIMLWWMSFQKWRKINKVLKLKWAV